MPQALHLDSVSHSELVMAPAPLFQCHTLQLGPLPCRCSPRQVVPCIDRAATSQRYMPHRESVGVRPAAATIAAWARIIPTVVVHYQQRSIIVAQFQRRICQRIGHSKLT